MPRVCKTILLITLGFILFCGVFHICVLLGVRHNGAAYRLGDSVRFLTFLPLFYPKESVASEYARKIKTNLHWNIYETSLRMLFNYFNPALLQNKKCNYDILGEIVNHRIRQGWDVLDPNVMSVHIRIGDVIENNPHSVAQFLQGFECKKITETDILVRGSHDGSDSCGYVYPLSFYQKHLTSGNIPAKIDTVYIIGGCHQHCNNLKKSKAYAQAIADLFVRHGYATQIHLTVNKPGYEARTKFCSTCVKPLFCARQWRFFAACSRRCSRARRSCFVAKLVQSYILHEPKCKTFE